MSTVTTVETRSAIGLSPTVSNTDLENVSHVVANNYLINVKSEFGIMWTQRVIQEFTALAGAGILIARDGMTVDSVSNALRYVPDFSALVEDFQHIGDITNELGDLSLAEKYALAKMVIEAARDISAMVNTRTIDITSLTISSNSVVQRDISFVKTLIDSFADLVKSVIDSGVFTGKIDMAFVLNNLSWLVKAFGQIKDLISMRHDILLDVEDLTLDEIIEVADIVLERLYDILKSH